jgi:hypothetical protein
MVSRQKVRVHESIYVLPLSTQQTSAEIQSVFKTLASIENADAPIDSMDFIDEGLELRPETDNNMVLSVKSLRNHKQKMIENSGGKMLDIEESAMYGNVDQLHEGIYIDSVIVSDANKLALEIEEAVNHGSTMRDALLKAIRKGSSTIQKDGLARGKNKKATGDVTSENIMDSKRKRHKVVRFDRISSLNSSSDKIDVPPASKSGESEIQSTNQNFQKSFSSLNSGEKESLPVIRMSRNRIFEAS